MSPRVVGFGAGGHCRVLLDILILDRDPADLVLLDPDPKVHGQNLYGVPILGGDDCLQAVKDLGANHFFIGAGSTGSVALRRHLFQFGQAAGLQPLEVVHPSALLSSRSERGPGLTAMARVVVNAGASLGANVVLNTAVIVEHDCRISDHAFLAPGALVMGGVSIGQGAFLGAGCVIRQGLRIGEGALVAAGAVVVRDVLAGEQVGGIPAHPLSR